MGSNVKMVPIGELCDFLSGFAFKSEDLKGNSGIPVVKIKNVNDKVVTLEDMQFFPENKLDSKISRFLLSDGDVLIAMTGQGSVGRVGRLTKSNESKLLLNQRVGKFIPKKAVACLDYIYYVLSSEKYEKILFNAAIGSGQPNLSPAIINSIYIPFIPLEGQIVVSRILSRLDKKITLNRQINQTLEQMAQTLFKSWFVDFDPVIDNALDAGFFEQDLAFSEELLRRVEMRKVVRERDDFKPLPEDIRQLFPNAFDECAEPALGLGGWVPTSWPLSNVGAEFDVTMGQSPPGSTYNETGNGLPFFQGKTDFGFRFPTNRIYCTAPKRMANKNDTLISVRAPVGDINLAAEDCAIGRGVAAARHKSGSISFTYYSMNSLSKYFEVFEGEGTVFGSINQKDFKALLFIKYPSELIDKFDFFCLEWDKRIDVQSIENIVLTQLRDTLLPKLISGELSLSELKIDIPEETLI